MIVKRIVPMSIAKLAGLLYAVIGFIVGCFFALISMVSGVSNTESFGPLAGLFVGAGAILFMPLFYGGLGFAGTYLSAVLYNVLARRTGGIEVEVDSERAAPATYQAPGPGTV